MTFRLVVASVLAFAAGCSEDAQTPEVGEAPEVVEVGSEPELEIFAAGAQEYPFTDVTGARFLSNGDILIANRANPPILSRFDPDGRHVWSVGQEGQGPGEFLHVLRIYVVPGDTILADDRRQARLSVFTRDGEFLRTVPVDEYPDQRGFRALSQIDALSTAEFVAIHNYWRERGEVVDGRRMSPMMRVTARGAIMDEHIVSFPTYHDLAPPPTRTRFGGRPVATAHRGKVLVGRDGFHVDLIEPDGTVLSSFRRSYPPRPVTNRLIEAQREAELAAMPAEMPELGRLSPERRRQMVEEIYEDVVFPEFLPAIHQVIADLPRSLWVQHFPVPIDPGPVWSVFAETGELIGEARLPAAFRMTDVHGDLILGVWTDDVGVQSVRSYRVHYPSSVADP